MKYLWIVFLIIAYIVAWVVFVVNVIDEINDCKRLYNEQTNIIDYIEWILDNDYIKMFLVAHAAVLFFISISMFFGEGGGE